MTSNLAFISQSISRSALYSSRLPQQCTKLQHLSNNLVAKSDSNLLFIGRDFAYSTFGNTHAKVSWTEEFSKHSKIQSQIQYNLIIMSENNLSAKMLIDLKMHLAKHVIITVMNSRSQIAEKMLERSIGFVPTLKIVSRVGIYDRNNDHGWGDGVLIYDIMNKDKDLS